LNTLGDVGYDEAEEGFCPNAFMDMSMRILLVEDESEFAETLSLALKRESFVVDHVDRLSLAQEAALTGSYELVLLDRRLPDGDGLSLVPLLRGTNPGLPIVVLSARGEVLDRIEGLDEGADDYLVKPFALEELFARIRALRRRPAELGAEEIRAGSLVFDLKNDEASVADASLDLGRRELRVLATLIKRRGRTVLRESLEQAVFGFDDSVQSNTLDSHISRLRRKLIDAGADVEIHAVRGVGYLLRVTS
jgi:DNA-binding response OmpR family regulator